MDHFPDAPRVPEQQQATAVMHLRFEDVSQTGHVMLDALPHGLGPAIWSKLIQGSPIAALMGSHGIIPILTRLVIEGGEGPIAAREPLHVRGLYQLAHTEDAASDVNRLILAMWLSATARRSRTYGPPPPGAGEPLPAGRVFAEHVFTRPFAAPGERKVLRFESPDLPAVPPERYPWRSPESLMGLPEGAQPLDPEPTLDPITVAFGLDHTDANQHVNSLVYPRIFAEAALRRFAAHGRSTALLARRVEVAYRKPCFAGMRVRIVLRAFTIGGAPGALGAFVPEPPEGPADAAPEARACCYIRTLFEG
ncbi:acyl-CoA thioesterase [Sorangium sp. So ce1036]|uniref:acyl-CoA thioesterase n=1 Tax=Sorangium sp. So ce1036 TaxID=3133328 RepID=UPI003F0A77EE